MSDGPMQRRLFVEMQPQEQAAHLAALQERRLRVVHKHQELVRAKQEATDEKVRAMLTKQCSTMQRDIDAAERAMSRIEERIIRITALRAMLEQGE